MAEMIGDLNLDEESVDWNLLEINKGLNLVLLGIIGAGKSASGNTILGRQAFKSMEGFTSVTQDVTVKSGIVCGRWVTVYDTPGLFNTKLSEDKIQQIYANVLQRCESGLCVFLLVIKTHRFTEKERETVKKIEALLGEERLKKTWILFTGGDELEEENVTIDEFIKPLRELFQKYDQRYHVFNNKKSQVQELLTKIYETYPDTIESEDELRIVLLGKTGVGKSATGNTILGRNAFKAEQSFELVTTKSQRETSDINGRRITVIDTPGLFDTELSNEEIQREIRHCISMILPGPHVFLLLIPLGRFTQEEQESVKIIQEMFGEKSLMFTIVLFTRGDDLTDKTIDQCLGKPGSVIRNLIEVCGNRYHVFNNNQTGDRTQVSDLLQKIDDMVNTNGGRFYSCKMFRQMEREQQMKILMDRVEQLNREREELMKKLDEEKERMKITMEEGQNNHDKERKRREEELKREIREQEKLQREIQDEMRREQEKLQREIQDEMRREREKLQREIRDEMRRERETFKHEIEEMRQEKQKLQIKFNTERGEWEKHKQTEKLRQEDEKMREREKQISGEEIQRLKSEMERIVREKERIERERREQLEDLEKRLKEVRDMREDQQNTFEEKLKLHEEQHEDELKRRRVEWREEYEREKEKMKRICTETDDSLQVAAYRKLETEYSKWSWSLCSAMMETENKLHNKIENEAINEVDETDLQTELKTTSEEVEKSMSEFFDKDKDKDILIQWKTSFEIKIKDIQENLVRETKKKLSVMLQQRDLKRKIDAQKTHHENTLYEKSKELALKLKDKENDEETLKTEFDLFWEQSVNMIIRDTPVIRDIDIIRDVREILCDIYEILRVEGRDIFTVQNYSRYIIFLKSNSFYPLHFWMKSLRALSKEDEAQIRSLVSDVDQQTERMIQSFNISKMGYNISCIKQLTDYIKMRVTEHQKGSDKYEFKNEFFIDLVYSICERANKTITDQHKLFRDANDPLLYLEKKREEYYSIFQKYCHGASSAAMFGVIICQKLKEPIEQSVYKKTARDLTGEIMKNCESLNGNRSNLEKHILKTLAEEEDFDKYMNYIKAPRDHFKSFIRNKVSRYITDKFSVSVLPKMKENIKLLQWKIMKAAHESTEHVQENRGDVGLWLKSFTQMISDELIFSEKDLSGVKHDDVDDFNLLEDVIRQDLCVIMSDIGSHFSKNTFPVKLDYKFRPDEILIGHFCQCCWVLYKSLTRPLYPP